VTVHSRFLISGTLFAAVLIVGAPATARVVKGRNSGGLDTAVTSMLVRSSARERQWEARDAQVMHSQRHLAAQEQRSEDVDDGPTHHRPKQGAVVP
jgi:hypothetical protein